MQVGESGIVYFGVGHTISHHDHVIMSWGYLSVGVQGRRDCYSHASTCYYYHSQTGICYVKEEYIAFDVVEISMACCQTFMSRHALKHGWPPSSNM